MKENNSILQEAGTKLGSYMETGFSLMPLAGQAYKTIAELNAPDINYEILNLRADQKDIEADALEVRSQENINYMRDQFNEAVGTYQYGAARRNVKVGEGSAGANIENSARDLGYDISKIKDMTAFESNIKRMEGERYRAAGESQKEITKWQKTSQLFDNISKLSGLFGEIDLSSLMPKDINSTGSIEDKTKVVNTTGTKTHSKKPEPNKVEAKPKYNGVNVGYNIPDEKTVNPNVRAI